MTHPGWAEVGNKELVFRARLIGFDGGNTVVGTPQGGIYLGLPTKNIIWDCPAGETPGPGHAGRLCVPLWVAKFHKPLTGST